MIKEPMDGESHEDPVLRREGSCRGPGIPVLDLHAHTVVHVGDSIAELKDAVIVGHDDRNAGAAA